MKGEKYIFAIIYSKLFYVNFMKKKIDHLRSIIIIVLVVTFSGFTGCASSGITDTSTDKPQTQVEDSQQSNTAADSGEKTEEKQYTKGKYTGTIVNDKREGKGTFKFINGDEYIGDWKDNKFSGSGKFVYANGNKYEGTYKDGLRSGTGTFTWKNGDEYEGKWSDDKINGQGIYRFKSGDKYEGQWSDNVMNGEGTYTKKNGTVKKGKWKHNKLIKED